MTHVWKRKLNNLNNCLEKNNFPKLRILTDTKGNVVYLDKILEVGDMFLDFCDDSDIQYLFNDIGEKTILKLEIKIKDVV